MPGLCPSPSPSPSLVALLPLLHLAGPVTPGPRQARERGQVSLGDSALPDCSKGGGKFRSHFLLAEDVNTSITVCPQESLLTPGAGSVLAPSCSYARGAPDEAPREDKHSCGPAPALLSAAPFPSPAGWRGEGRHGNPGNCVARQGPVTLSPGGRGKAQRCPARSSAHCPLCQMPTLPQRRSPVARLPSVIYETAWRFQKECMNSCRGDRTEPPARDLSAVILCPPGQPTLPAAYLWPQRSLGPLGGVNRSSWAEKVHTRQGLGQERSKLP